MENKLFFINKIELFKCEYNEVEYYRIEYTDRESGITLSYLIEPSLQLYISSLPMVSDYKTITELLDPLK